MWWSKAGRIGGFGGGWLEHPRPWHGARWARLFPSGCLAAHGVAGRLGATKPPDETPPPASPLPCPEAVHSMSVRAHLPALARLRAPVRDQVRVREEVGRLLCTLDELLHRLKLGLGLGLGLGSGLGLG